MMCVLPRMCASAHACVCLSFPHFDWYDLYALAVLGTPESFDQSRFIQSGDIVIPLHGIANKQWPVRAMKKQSVNEIARDCQQYTGAHLRLEHTTAGYFI